MSISEQDTWLSNQTDEDVLTKVEQTVFAGVFNFSVCVFYRCCLHVQRLSMLMATVMRHAGLLWSWPETC